MARFKPNLGQALTTPNTTRPFQSQGKGLSPLLSNQKADLIIYLASHLASQGLKTTVVRLSAGPVKNSGQRKCKHSRRQNLASIIKLMTAGSCKHLKTLAPATTDWRTCGSKRGPTLKRIQGTRLVSTRRSPTCQVSDRQRIARFQSSWICSKSSRSLLSVPTENCATCRAPCSLVAHQIIFRCTVTRRWSLSEALGRKDFSCD